jgi:peptidoglycan/xylan/chitin deacetylase (PgdA/CDA1 family)
MIFLIKKGIKRAIARTKFIFQSKPNTGGVRILMYHSIGGVPQDHRLAIRIPVSNFRDQLEELSRQGYIFVTVSELIENSLSFRTGKTIAITFDDGYKDNFTEAAIALKKAGLKATFFIITSFIDGRNHKIWVDGSHRQYLHWEDVCRLLEMGFEVGSHMVDHISLSSLDESQINFQLEESKKRIEKMTGVKPKVLSYPYGKFNARVRMLAQNAGYIGGCSSFSGINQVTADPYILKRTEIDGYDTIYDFRAKLNGLYD